MENRNTGSFMWMYAVVLILALAVLGWGAYLMANKGGPTVLAAGCVGVLGTLAIWCLNLNLNAARQDSTTDRDRLLAPVNERLQHISVLLNTVSEQQLISERAKGIAFRESERDALRRAIREETAKKDWDAALVLADEIERVFGYKLEAERFRNEINQQREEEVRKMVNEGILAIDRHCRAEQWTQALREAERLIRLYPHDLQAQRLPQDIEIRRQAHKRQLLESWQDAVARHDVDGSIEILKKLDLYLTPAEAETMQDTARRMFKDKLQLLGQQFTLAVRDHKWTEAIVVGETIMSEFPNSRMAQEVRDKMDLLRQRAGEAETAKV